MVRRLGYCPRVERQTGGASHSPSRSTASDASARVLLGHRQEPQGHPQDSSPPLAVALPSIPLRIQAEVGWYNEEWQEIARHLVLKIGDRTARGRNRDYPRPPSATTREDRHRIFELS